MEAAVNAPVRAPIGAGRIAAATVVGLIALLVGAAGVTGVWAIVGKSDHTYISTGTHRYAASGRAIVSDPLHVGRIPDWLTARIRVATTSAGGKATFVGVARKTDVDRYLARVAHSTVEDVDYSPFKVAYGTIAGSAVPARPSAQAFWAVSAVGRGTQTVTWKIREGQWRVVVMNADGSPKVAADAKVGASVAHALVYTLVLLGLAVALGALVVLLVSSPERRRR
jgi:hypothetical protein